MNSVRFLALGAAALILMAPAHAEENLSGTVATRIGPIELQGGYPGPDSIGKLYDEIDFQRASQAYVWGDAHRGDGSPAPRQRARLGRWL